MCTLIVLRQVVPGQALVVASNRDEYRTRPAAPPRVVEASTEGSLAFVAPQDFEAGGTWIGMNAAGVFIGLTNRPTGETRTDEPDVRSRGLLVRDLLGLGHVDAVRRALADVRGEGASAGPSKRAYRPFQLVACDARVGLHASLGEGEARPKVSALPPGIHVIGNRDPEDPSCKKVRWVRDEVEALDLGASREKAVEGLMGVLRAHPFGRGSTESPCVHRSDFGTRSSTVFACAAGRWRAWHAEGAPCRNPYENYTPLLEAIQRPCV